MHYRTPAQKRGPVNRIRPILTLLTAALLVVLSACEAPTGLSDSETIASEPNALLATGADAGVIVDADGIARPLGAEDVEAFAETPGEQGTAAVITGNATFDDNTWSALRLNVRQTRGGTTTGQGRVTLSGQTTGFTPVCVKQKNSWGRSYYGITMKLDEPHNRYGNAYEYVTVTVTGDGQLSPGAIFRHTPVCGYSAALYPKDPKTGQINVTIMEQ
mgnify:CR=1 FL=1